MHSYSLYGVGDSVKLLGQPLQVCELKYTLRHDIIYCVYRLAAPDYFKIRQRYNESMRGLSLHGTVLKTDRELLRLHLDIDQSQDTETAYDYTWRPETGNLMYLMPEVGTRASLYMQDEDEFGAISKNCDRTNGEQFPEAQNPDDRYLTTAHGKRMFWMPSEAGFTSLSVGSSVKLDDAVGAIIKNAGTLLLQADGDVTVAGSSVNLSAPKEVTVVRRKVGAPTVLNASYNFDIVGNTAVCRTAGHICVTYAEYEEVGRWSMFFMLYRKITMSTWL